LSQNVAKSLARVSGKHPKVLILGSMPGQASLQAAQYYAHPRNAFWPILISIIHDHTPNFEATKQWDYNQRLQLACDHGYALWDVLAQCERPGSLDSKILRQSEIANPINVWLEKSPSIARICFNGKTAAALFNRHIQQKLSPTVLERPLQFFTLPSSSPAMASLNLEQKKMAWLEALEISDA